MSEIDEGVRLGEHSIDGQKVNVRARRIPRKVAAYARLLKSLFSERVGAREPIVWVDFGAGYGEIIEAVSKVMPAGSKAIGVEPMVHKAENSRARGLDVRGGYPEPDQFQADVVSMVNIFSHIPDFTDLLRIAATNLKPSGELFIETGNLADLECRSEFPGILDLPDHLVFSGVSQMERMLDQAGFQIVEIEHHRVDGPISFVKDVAKALLGRPVILRAPYTSNYRQLMIRARLKTALA
jgi:SAM-dependent methyltransferase